MIAKVPTKRNDGNSSFGSLGKYMTADQIDKETGEIKREAADVHVETNCLFANTATAEMRAVADQNTRVKDPVYHCILSWKEGENPTNEQMVEAAKAAQKAVGMDGHQHVFAIHRDTDNHHVHMMVNRVNPETYKAVYPDRDFYKLDKCMRQVELAHGWQHDAGPYEVKNGKVVQVERQPEKAPTLPTKARDMESSTKCESLATYAQQAKADALEAIQTGSWQELHSALRKHGLEIREAGQGFRIHSTSDANQTPIKASDMAQELGGGKLKKRLGEYEKPIRLIQAEKPARTYSKNRERDQNQRAEQRERRAAMRQELRQQYDAEKGRHTQRTRVSREARRGDEKDRFKEIAEYAKTERAAVRERGYTPEAKKALYSTIAMQTVQKRERLKVELQATRQAEKMPSYREWVAEQAKDGNEAALSQLKGWQYADKRKAKEAEKSEAKDAELGAIRADRGHDPQRPHTFTDGISWDINTRTGDVTYKLDGQAAFRDSGKQVAFIGSTDDKTVAAGLMLARQKFGQTLHLTGTDEFKAKAIEVAVKQGMDIKIHDPKWEQYRCQLTEQTKQAAHEKEMQKLDREITKERGLSRGGLGR